MIFNFFTDVFAKRDESNMRYQICKSCENYKNDFCGICKCYLPAKVKVKAYYCPINKWTKIE